MKRTFAAGAAFLLALCLMLTAALADGWRVTDGGLDMPGGSVHFPILDGDAPAEALAEWNARITGTGDTENALGQLLQRGSGSLPVTETYEWSREALSGDLFSCCFELTGLQGGHRWHSLVLDLRTGAQLTPADLFQDPEEGFALLERILLERVAPALSPMLPNKELLPVPASFAVDSWGVMLYYERSRLQTLADRAGRVKLRWSELEPDLRQDPESVWIRSGGQRMVQGVDRAALEELMAAGSLPGIPAALGERIQPLLDRWGLAEDPDLYTGGRMFALEDGAFRETWLLSDALTDGWEESTVQGIRTDCADLLGLCTGRTAQAEWRGLLGDPDSSLAVDAEQAEALRTVPGISDYYRIGGHTLKLHGDEAGVLVSIWLLE